MLAKIELDNFYSIMYILFMKKNGKLNEAARNALNKVVICENKIKALHYAISGLDRKFELYHDAKLDFSRLHCLLY